VGGVFSIVEQSRIEGGDAEITGGIIDRFHMADTVYSILYCGDKSPQIDSKNRWHGRKERGSAGGVGDNVRWNRQHCRIPLDQFLDIRTAKQKECHNILNMNYFPVL